MHSDSAVVARSKDKCAFHAAVVSAGGKKSADGSTLKAVKILVLDVGGTERIANRC